MPAVSTPVPRDRSRVSSPDAPPPDEETAEAPARDTGRLVLAVALTCVLAAMAVRAWALQGGWFYLDDYELVAEAREEPLSWSYLVQAGAGHISPGGRAFFSWIAATGPLNWGLAGAGVVVTQGLAGLAATWALFSLFGRRWAVLVPLNLYLWSAITMPAMMWLSGAILLVPQQLSFWLALGAWVHYLRSRSMGWLGLSLVGVLLGLGFDVKSILTVPVLAYVALAYFGAGSIKERLRGVVGGYGPALAVFGSTAAAYVVLYTSRGSAPLRAPSPGQLADLASEMIGDTFATTAVGGPWRWSETNAPTVYAAAPAWAQHLSWVLISAVVVAGWLLRHRSLRAWALLLAYLGVLLLLLASSRGLAFGIAVGGEPRYFTDAAMVLALCVGLAFLTLPGAPGSSSPRAEPHLTIDLRLPAIALAVAVCAGALVSSISYAHVWHTDNASEHWIDNLRAGVRAIGAVDMADTTLPPEVIDPILAPRNSVADLAPLASGAVRFPTQSSNLVVAAGDGTIRQAAIEPGVSSQVGPRPGCGWLVKDRGRTIPLAGRAFTWRWWVRIGYLAGQDSPVVVSAGRTTVEADVSNGLNNLYVRVDGSFDSVRIEGLDRGASMCVSTVEVGQPVPGGQAK